ncbi:MAG: hypothetical protein P4L64_16535 [Caulobacteraceae bacterium]|nr:hypothetical protein [Caulobacteraceae bacterium]
MIEAHEFAVTPWAKSPQAQPDTRQLLVEGGDARLALDPITGKNRYGCPPCPDPAMADFASSTGSVISERGFAAADALRARLFAADPRGPAADVYAQELQRVRERLIALCGLEALGAVDIVFAASGTDLHLLISELVGDTPAAPLTCIDVEPEETGSGVPAALAGKHFGGHAPLGAPVVQGALIGAAAPGFVAVRCRAADGSLRPTAEIELELDTVADQAIRAGGRVMLAVSDVSKTGLISPSLKTVMAFKRRFGAAAEVVIDACQFRLTPESLRAYLAQGFMVAVTGSKFLTGPSFSSALFVPPAAAERLRDRLVSPGLRAYSARAEWPRGWVAAAALPDAVNPGLLLRWEAALAELEAFQALPRADLDAFAARFAKAVREHIAAEPMFEFLEVRPLDRAAIGGGAGWDLIPTIFPFLLRHAPGGEGGYLSLAATQDVYRGLCADPFPPQADAIRGRLGQPVMCGERGGRPISALRLCNSARLMVEAVEGGEAGAKAVIARALAVLDRTALAARRLSQGGRV